MYVFFCCCLMMGGKLAIEIPDTSDCTAKAAASK